MLDFSNENLFNQLNLIIITKAQLTPLKLMKNEVFR